MLRMRWSAGGLQPLPPVPRSKQTGRIERRVLWFALAVELVGRLGFGWRLYALDSGAADSSLKSVVVGFVMAGVLAPVIVRGAVWPAWALVAVGVFDLISLLTGQTDDAVLSALHLVGVGSLCLASIGLWMYWTRRDRQLP